MQLTLKLPILSASMPARGGMTIDMTGVTADMMAVSSTLMPSSRMCIVRYGYNTNRAKKVSNVHEMLVLYYIFFRRSEVREVLGSIPTQDKYLYNEHDRLFCVIFV